VSTSRSRFLTGGAKAAKSARSASGSPGADQDSRISLSAGTKQTKFSIVPARTGNTMTCLPSPIQTWKIRAGHHGTRVVSSSPR
jgi:hypothetical protein